jgi:hypothetical protein
MDRLDTIDQAFADAEAQALRLIDDRRDIVDRDVVAYYEDDNGQWQPSPLKVGDDVVIAGQNAGRVVGPAAGRGWFTMVEPSEWGPTVGTYMLLSVTDRAPLDENETPMPLIPTTP